MSSSLLPEGESRAAKREQGARPSGPEGESRAAKREQGARGARWSPGTWSLRSRLLIGLVALLALVCLLIGAATELALRQYLVNQLDQTLQDTSRRSIAAASPSKSPSASAIPRSMRAAE